MSLNKRPRKVKLVWDTASEFHACLVTNENLTHNMANISGMEKDEENEIDLRKAVDAQANHLKHEIQIPEVNLRNDLIVRRSDLLKTNEKAKPEDECVTSYTVISNVYPPDEEDERFCRDRNQSVLNLRWYFTLCSTGPDGFSNDLRYSQFPGMTMDEFRLLQLYYEKKIERCRKDSTKCSHLLPPLERFRHQHNGSGSYSCFQPRPPKISTRRKFVVELKALQHCFEVRQNAFDIAGIARLLHVRNLVDLKSAREWNTIANQLKKKPARIQNNSKTPYNRLTCNTDTLKMEVDTKPQINGLLKPIVQQEKPTENSTNECEQHEVNGVKPSNNCNGIKAEVVNNGGEHEKLIINGTNRAGSSQSIENEKKKPESMEDEKERESRSCSVEIGYVSDQVQKPAAVNVTTVIPPNNSINEDVEMMDYCNHVEKVKREDLLLPEVARLDTFLRRKKTKYNQRWMRGYSPERDLTYTHVKTGTKQAYTEYLLSLLVDAKKDQELLMLAKKTATEMKAKKKPAIRIETFDLPEDWKESDEPLDIDYGEVETIYEAFKNEKFIDFENESVYVTVPMSVDEKEKLRKAFISRKKEKDNI